MGKGLFCSDLLKKGSFVTEYTGEVFYKNSNILKAREDLYSISSHSYFMSLTSKHTIDAT